MRSFFITLAIIGLTTLAAAQCTPQPQPQPQPAAPASPATPDEAKTKETVPPYVHEWRAVTPASSPTPEDELVIAAVGDVMLGSTWPDTSGNSLPPDDGAHLLDDVAPILRASDFAFGNLEGPLYDGTNPSYKCAHRAANTCYAFRVPTRYAKLLADASPTPI